jgi:hypothetical protein
MIGRQTHPNWGANDFIEPLNGRLAPLHEAGSLETRIMVRGSAPPNRWLVGSAHRHRRGLATRRCDGGFTPPWSRGTRRRKWRGRDKIGMNSPAVTSPGPRSRARLVRLAPRSWRSCSGGGTSPHFVGTPQPWGARSRACGGINPPLQLRHAAALGGGYSPFLI